MYAVYDRTFEEIPAKNADTHRVFTWFWPTLDVTHQDVGTRLRRKYSFKA